jgi:PAS domain S-box-containing protein
LKTTRHPKSARPAPARDVAGLRRRLAEAEATLRAILAGEVDTLLVNGRQGPQTYTLHGAEHSYRVLIESMNEGALTIAADHMILYANQCFARMVNCPLEQVIGGSLGRFLSPADRATLRPLLKRIRPAGRKIQMSLKAVGGAHLPVQISIRPLARNGFKGVVIGMVVTDLTESRRNEGLLRDLSNRLVQAQEAERGRVALELHDHITQLLCGILVRCQTLADKLPAGAGPARAEARKLRQLLGRTAEDVERISHDLRPGILEYLGLAAVLRDTSDKFTKRTGISVKLTCVQLTGRLAPDIELTLYRILQEALKNVEQHSRARQVTVLLTKSGGGVQLVILDDGTGFNPDHPPVGQTGKGGLGLLGMRERAAYVGGVLEIKSTRRAGTEIKIHIPLPPDPAATPPTDL